MPVGRVVDDEIDQHADAAALGLSHELDEVAARAEPRIDAVVVRNVVAVVAARRRLEGREPHRVDAERLEVVEPPAQALEVAAAVAACVEERLDVEAVDDRVLVPEVVNHPADTAWRIRYIACDQSSGSADDPHRATHAP